MKGKNKMTAAPDAPSKGNGRDGARSLPVPDLKSTFGVATGVFLMTFVLSHSFAAAAITTGASVSALYGIRILANPSPANK